MSKRAGSGGSGGTPAKRKKLNNGGSFVDENATIIMSDSEEELLGQPAGGAYGDANTTTTTTTNSTTTGTDTSIDLDATLDPDATIDLDATLDNEALSATLSAPLSPPQTATTTSTASAAAATATDTSAREYDVDTEEEEDEEGEETEDEDDEWGGDDGPASMHERYVAACVLSGVGDAIGYKNSVWEFNYSGKSIHAAAAKLGGVAALDVDGWCVSDDTVMHLATMEALVGEFETIGELLPVIAQRYVVCWGDMDGRSPGAWTAKSIESALKKGKLVSAFNNKAGGCGAAMRTMAIGLAYPRPSQRGEMIAVSIESGRMTHNHPTAFFGGVASAFFTTLALQKVPIQQWGRELMELLPFCYNYLEDSDPSYTGGPPPKSVRGLPQSSVYRYKKASGNGYKYFEEVWRSYLALRGIEDGVSQPVFPAKYGVVERDEFYTSVAFQNVWGGSSGHDAPLIAYDALLGCGGDWCELIRRACLHGGDSDSTGVIACTWYGALYGFRGVPKNHYAKLEYGARLRSLANQLYTMHGPVDDDELAV